MKELINFLCLPKQSLKDNDKPAHWVTHSKLGSSDIDELFTKAPKLDKYQGSVTGNTEEEYNEAENTPYDADENEYTK